MTRAKVELAVAEAERFIRAAKNLLNDSGFDPTELPGVVSYRSHPAKKGGATRRASIDLTRALTEMRRPA